MLFLLILSCTHLRDLNFVNKVTKDESKLLLKSLENKSEEDINKVNTSEVNKVDSFDRTPLMNASFSGDVEKVKELIKAGAEVNFVNKKGMTALMFASFKGHKKIAKILLNNKANIDQADVDGNTALFDAVLKNRENIVELLIKRGADINKRNNFDSTLLIWASNNDKPKMIEFLISKGATCEANDNDFTPLMKASANNSVENVKIFLKYEVDVNRKDKDGKSALDYAREQEAQEAEALLLSHGALSHQEE